MLKTARKATLIIIAIAVCIAFAAYAEPAAAASKPGKTVLTKAYAVDEGSAVLKWKKAKGAKGYQIYRNGQLVKRVAGAKKLSFTDTGLEPGSEYTYKVSAYKTKKVKQYFNKKTGKWQKKKPPKKYRGKAKKVATYVSGKASNQKTVITPGDYYDPDYDYDTFRYTYEVRFFNQPYGECFNGMFIKTDNPECENFDIVFRRSDGTEVLKNRLIMDFDDLPPHNSAGMISVAGGYVEVQEIDAVGEVTVEVKEYPRGRTSSDYANYRCSCAAKTLGRITAKDYAAEEQAWMDTVISQATTSSMSKKEKMQSITNYLYDIAKYYKNYTDKNGEMHYLFFITDYGVPAWKSCEWDSYTSPSLLVRFGEKIGYPLHSMYGDYPYGSEGWSQYHWYAKNLDDGTLYGFCRMPDTNHYPNIHSTDDVEKVNCLTYDKFYYCH